MRLPIVRIIYSLPLVMLFVIQPIDFLALQESISSAEVLFGQAAGDEAVREAAEVTKANVLYVVYVLVLVLALIKSPGILNYLLRVPHIILLCSYLFVGVVYSELPIKVVTNTILLLITYISAILFCTEHKNNNKYQSLYILILISMLGLHLYSYYLLFNAGFAVGDFVDLIYADSNQRFAGISGNPNSFGYTCVVGFFASLSICATTRFFHPLFFLGFFCGLLFLLSVSLAGSATSLIAMVVAIISTLTMKFVALISSKARWGLALSVSALMSLVGIFFAYTNSATQLYANVTAGLGKDETLTGRTVLWETALAAIAERPLFGWGYDSHYSVKLNSAFAVEQTSYHNGFLDIMVDGGIILFILALYCVFRYCRFFFTTFAVFPKSFPLIVPVILLLIMNISEYSILRPGGILWLLFTSAFVLLSYQKASVSKVRSRSRSKRKKRIPRADKRKQLASK